MSARTRGRVATATILLSGVAIAVVGSRPASPFTPPLPRGEVAGWPFRGGLSLFGIEELSRDAVAALGAVVIFAAAMAFLYALRRAWAREVSVGAIVTVSVALHLLALAMPVFLSRDVYSYAFYGRMISAYGANPYADIPAAFATDPGYPFVSVDWIDSPSVYGPAFSAVSAGVTEVAGTTGQAVVAFKLLAAAASLATLLLVLSAARRVMPERTAFAAALVGWNPVVVFHGVAGAHNDALLGLAIAGAAVAILLRRELLATGVLALGALVKVSGGIPLAIAVAAAAARRGGGWLRGAVLHAGLAALLAVPFVVAFLQREDPTLGAMELATRQGWLAPSRLVLQTLRGAARWLGGDVAADVVSLLVRVAFPLVFVWALVQLVRHLARDPVRISPPLVIAAMGWASLISVLVAPVLLPWYAAWVVPLAWVLPRPARGGAVLLSLALTITELVAEPARAPGLYEAMVFGLHWVATPVMLLVLIRLLLDLRRRVALGPGPGLLDPLVSEEMGEPSSAAAVREHGPRDAEGSGEPQRRRSGGQQADPVGGDRRQDHDRGAD